MFAAKAGKTQVSGGGGSVLDSQIVGSGLLQDVAVRVTGFLSASGTGTCTDGTSNIYSGASITGLYHDEDPFNVVLQIIGSHANSGWTTMTTSTGAVFSRSVADYYILNGTTFWKWIAFNPFPIGQNITCTFT